MDAQHFDVWKRIFMDFRTLAVFYEIRSFLCCDRGLAFTGWRLGGAIDVGFAFQFVAARLCFRDKSQLKLKFLLSFYDFG